MRALLLVIATVASVLVGCAAETTEEETESSDSELLAGRRLSETEVARLLRDAGFPESVVPEMVCTARYESSFFEAATNRNTNGSIDRGLFQINSVHVSGTRGCPSTGAALFDAATNARCAYAIYRSQGLNAWYGYRNHRAECDRYTLGSSGGGDSCRSSTLGRTVDERTCVQSRSDRAWYQCVDGRWRAGASATSGASGACSASYPL